jgi:hypothetical protein
MSSSAEAEAEAEAELADYKARIEEHRTKIKQIEADSRYDLADGYWTGLVKAENDGILAWQTAIHDLRQQQLQQQGNSYSAYACFTFCGVI